MTGVQEWFDSWASRYDEYLPNFPAYKRIIELVVENANVKTGDKVLDVGIGTGNVGLSIFNWTHCKITGVDISKEMTAIAKKKAKEMGAQFNIVESSADTMELSETFDCAVAVFSMHHLKGKAKSEAFKRVHKSLKKGGRFILADVTVDVDPDVKNERWLRHVMDRWSNEAASALRYIGPDAVDIAFDGMKKVYHMDGEYTETFMIWKQLLEGSGFRIVRNEVVDEKMGWQVFICDK